MQPIVQELVTLVETHGWRDAFEQAIRNAQAHEVPAIRDIQSLEDYLRYVDELATWAPRQRGDTRLLYERMVKLYFFLAQEPLRGLQSPIRPDVRPQQLTPLSRWLVEYADAWGEYLDTPESAKEVESFRTDPAFNWSEYMPPPSGYRTFNQFFARQVKPGMRPVAGLREDAVLVSPADSTFIGWWQIDDASEIQVEEGPLSIKGLRWSIRRLLEGSAFADRFRGGIFTHAFLDTFDYHRWHAPVRGKVVEARVLQGQVFVDVEARPAIVDGQALNVLEAVDGTGFQFVQTRGLVVLESPLGLVACVPVGMGPVSSVVITAEVGVTLRKGEELGYFQFGASDFVMVFERAANVQLTARPDVHYRQGACVGNAFPGR